MHGVPYYNVADHALDFRPDGDACVGTRRSSIALGTLLLEVSISDGRCLWLWGYCPASSWSHRPVAVPCPDRRGMAAEVDGELMAGISIAKGPKIWPATFDIRTGWLLIEQVRAGAADGHAIEFATDTVALLTDAGDLSAVLVRPQNWELMRAQHCRR